MKHDGEDGCFEQGDATIGERLIGFLVCAGLFALIAGGAYFAGR